MTAHTASVIAALEPVYGIALALALLGEVPGPRTLAGGVLIVAARGDRNAAREPRHGWLAAAGTGSITISLESASRMQIGIVGLGRMGGNMARRLRRAGVEVIGFDADAAAAASLAAEQVLEPAVDRRAREATVAPADRMADGAGRTRSPSSPIQDLWPELARGDLDRRRRQRELQGFAAARPRGRLRAACGFVDCGVSGGVWGLDNGYTLMFGGDAAAAAMIEPSVKHPCARPRRRMAALRVPAVPDTSSR